MHTLQPLHSPPDREREALNIPAALSNQTGELALHHPQHRGLDQRGLITFIVFVIIIVNIQLLELFADVGHSRLGEATTDGSRD